MKTKNLLFFAGIMLCSFNLIAQNTFRDTTFKGNLIDGIAPPSSFYIKKGDEVRFIINDINRNLYDISVNNVYKSLHTNQPVLFNALTDLDISKLSDLLKPDSAAADGALKEKKLPI